MINIDVKYDGSEFKKMEEELMEEMESTIRDVADQILALSQQKVPVDKGTLKKSGNVRYGRRYALIGYNTPYAEDIHDGHPQHDRVVRAHQRMMESGAVISVRTHIRHMNQSTGRPYLDDAIKEVLRTLPPDVRNSISVTRMEREY